MRFFAYQKARENPNSAINRFDEERLAIEAENSSIALQNAIELRNRTKENNSSMGEVLSDLLSLDEKFAKSRRDNHFKESIYNAFKGVK